MKLGSSGRSSTRGCPQHSCNRYVATANGACGGKFVSPCCKPRTLHWRELSNLPAAFLLPNSATFSTPRAFPKEPKSACDRQRKAADGPRSDSNGSRVTLFMSSRNGAELPLSGDSAKSRTLCRAGITNHLSRTTKHAIFRRPHSKSIPSHTMLQATAATAPLLRFLPAVQHVPSGSIPSGVAIFPDRHWRRAVQSQPGPEPPHSPECLLSPLHAPGRW